MSSLLEKMLKSGTIKKADVLRQSKFFNDVESVPTEIPILNVAFSGSVDGGFVPGITVISGESKSFKTLLSLYCCKSYMSKYEDAVCLLYDSEFGITPQYLKNLGLDTSRIIHIPIENVEELKFDIVKRLESIELGDKVFILLDSLGALASKKEVDDAINQKSVADMTRAKAIRSLLRIVTPLINLKQLPFMIVNHVYMTMDLFSKAVIPGGQAVTLSADSIFIITKAQIKKGIEVAGYRFMINIEKSRFVKEKSKFPFRVTYENGIDKRSGLLDLAIESGFILRPNNVRYRLFDFETNTHAEKGIFEKNIPNSFYEQLVKHDGFKEFIRKKYSMANEFISDMNDGGDEEEEVLEDDD